MEDLIMDTGYRFQTERETHLFLNSIYDLEIEGINIFIDDSREPCGIVILRFRGQADLTGLDCRAARYRGERMYLPGDWRIRFMDYDLVSIENPE